MSRGQRMNAKSIRNMKPEDRAKLLQELRAELLKLQSQRVRGTLDNPGRLRVVRRAIARVLTIMREEELRGLRGKAPKG